MLEHLSKAVKNREENQKKIGEKCLPFPVYLVYYINCIDAVFPNKGTMPKKQKRFGTIQRNTPKNSISRKTACFLSKTGKTGR